MKVSGTPNAVDPVRSRVMASIRNSSTKPELVVRRALFQRGFRYRTNVRTLPGSPDIVLPRYRAAILVHGCFWHRHAGCRFFQLPKTRQDFWDAKLQANTMRDVRNVEALRAIGWRVAVVWECATRHAPERFLEELVAFICGDGSYTEISD